MTKRFTITLAMAVMVAPALAATPTYEQAVKVPEQVRSVVSASGVWNTKPMAARLQAYKDAEQLESYAKRLFGAGPAGPFADCVKAATGLKFYVSALNRHASSLGRSAPVSQADLFAPMMEAFDLGEAYGACYEALDALDTKAPSPKR